MILGGLFISLAFVLYFYYKPKPSSYGSLAYYKKVWKEL